MSFVGLNITISRHWLNF